MMKLSEDYTAIIISVVLIFVAWLGVVFWFPSITWSNLSELTSSIGSLPWLNILILFGLSFGIIWLTSLIKGEPLPFETAPGYLFVFLITLIAHILTGYGPAKGMGLEIVIFSLLISPFTRQTAASNRTLY